MRDRELEIQSDARDKQREMEEIEEVLRKQLAGGTMETRTPRKQTTGGFLPQHSHHSDKENEVLRNKESLNQHKKNNFFLYLNNFLTVTKKIH